MSAIGDKASALSTELDAKIKSLRGQMNRRTFDQLCALASDLRRIACDVDAVLDEVEAKASVAVATEPPPGFKVYSTSEWVHTETGEIVAMVNREYALQVDRDYLRFEAKCGRTVTRLDPADHHGDLVVNPAVAAARGDWKR